MSIVNFVGSVWAAGILKALDPLLVYGNPEIINSDYEGDITNVGDSVRIDTLGDVTVKDYVKGVPIDAPEDLTDAELTLIVDQAKYFNFAVNDIDRYQAREDLKAEAERRAAIGLRQKFDTFIAAHYTDIATANFVGSDTVPITGFSADSKKAYNQLAEVKQKLDDTETPEDGRWVVVPTWYEKYLMLDDRAISFGTPENKALMREGTKAGENGLIGEAAGFSVYRSTAVPNVGGVKHKVICGHKSAWSRAQQILETEAYRPESHFSDALKGLHTYGAKVIRPSNLACLVASDV